MTAFARTDTSVLGRWWWTVDRWALAAVIILAAIGAVMTLAASPPVAIRIGLEPFHFVRRQLVFLPLAVAVATMVSLLGPKGIRRLALIGFVAALVATAAVPVLGTEVKGAVRWIQLGAFSVQPSEFLKPTFIVVAAWMFAERRLDDRFPGNLIATLLFLLVCGLLLLQPDVGMTVVVAIVWGVQFFLAGLPLVLVGLIAVVFVGGAVGAYMSFAHVQYRVDRFLDPEAKEGYQVEKALQAFQNGGLFGRGPGEGQVKSQLPDAHADFIFAVAGEEFGLLICVVIVALFAFIVLRGFARVYQESDLFVMLAASGLLVMFGLQALINMASTVHLMPPKGMTLPFISYGGSSTLALALGIGMVLALTRGRPGQRSWPQ